MRGINGSQNWIDSKCLAFLPRGGGRGGPRGGGVLVTTGVQPAAQGPHVVAQGQAQSYGIDPSVPYVVPHLGMARDDDVWGNNGWERGDAATVMAGVGVMPGSVPPPPPLPSAQSDEAAVAEQSERRTLHQLIEALRQELIDEKVGARE